MCGIVGIYSFSRNITDKKQYINWCLNDMQHRGPDSNGIWHNDKNYITGFVRLAIQDISECGNQPMLSSCGNYCITFNGEIYNAEKFKKQLQAKGIEFRSSGDTEVLLYALIHFGLDKVLSEFDGMYAFAFYDSLKDEVVIARDRLGIKPLYIGFNKNEDVIYSSQYNHIINHGSIADASMDFSVIGSYLQLGYVSSGLGIMKDTQLLPHGHYCRINSQGHSIKKYFTVEHSGKRSYSAEDLEDAVADAVKSQLISDVPIGTFLSGGTDSSLVTILANKENKIVSFTSGTNEAETDEKKEAKWLADKFGIPNFTKDITAEAIMQSVNDNTKAYSEPFADFSSLPSLLISKYARQKVKVVLSGDGPDELFWGYLRTSQKMLKDSKNFQRPWLVNAADYGLSKLGARPKDVSRRMLFSKTFSDYYYRSLFLFGSDIWVNKIIKETPTEAYFKSHISEVHEQSKNDEDVMNMIWDYEMNIHLQRILLKMDRASMYNSLEARVPYLSNKILSMASQTIYTDCMSGNKGKMNLKKVLEKYTGPEFVNRQKRGFLVPMRQWMRNELKQEVTEKLMDMPDALSIGFNKKQLANMLKLHVDGKADYCGTIWAVYSLVNWHNHHLNTYKNS
jgi:asparagine synthase (glutamine-hydrolysing)